MSTIQISNVSIDVQETWGTFEGKPLNPVPGDNLLAKSQVAKFSSPDGLVMLAGLNIWPDGQMDFRTMDFIAGPDSYRRLERAGRLEVKSYAGDSYGAYIRALRISGKDYPTLGGVTWRELDNLLGSSAKDFLTSLGATALGTAEEVLGATNRNREFLAIQCPQDDVRSLHAMWGMTRVLAVMKGLGSDLPGALG